MQTIILLLLKGHILSLISFLVCSDPLYVHIYVSSLNDKICIDYSSYFIDYKVEPLDKSSY